MAQNKAAQDLANLNQASQGVRDQASREAAAATERGSTAGMQVVDGEAEFALPEALATGVAAGWLLGPIGGIALGITQGILGKNAKQNALDQFAEEQDVISGVSDTIGDELTRMEQTARNADDLDQVSTMRTQKDAAIQFMTSASPRLQEQGAKMLDALSAEMTDYSDRQETQRIADEELDAQLRRELDDQQYDRFNSIKVRFDRDSGEYEATVGAVNTAMAALNEGTPAQLHAASVLVNKALDPTGVVRPEEAEAFGKLAGLRDRLAVQIEKLANGKTLLPQQARELQGLLGTIKGQAEEIQLAREARYLTELDDAGVPQKYWDNFTLVESVPAVAPATIPETGEDAPAAERAADAITGPVTDALENTFGPDATSERQRRSRERQLLSPGLWQPGGYFGRELTPEEQAERDQIIERKGRPTN